MSRSIGVLVAAALAVAAVGSADRSGSVVPSGDVAIAGEVTASPPATNPAPTPRDRIKRAPAETPVDGAVPPRSPSSLASRVEALPPAAGIPDARTVTAPVSLRFEAIGVLDAPIDGVGVLDNGEMEVPGAERVGWYRYGPSPGEDGSAVLAAHIAYDGRRGVFRFLGDATPGDVFTVTFDDGSTRTYEVTAKAQYAKDELPFDEVFARTGSPVVTLISCGGEFQPSLRSYEDNIVVYAVPIG